VVIPGAFRESFSKDTVIKSVAPIQNRYRKIIHVSVPPQGKKEGKTLQQLHALYRKQGPSEESNKNPYENAASRYVENIWFPVSGRWTVVLLA